MGGFTHSIIFEPWAAGAYAAVEANCSEHGNHNPGVGGSSPSLATISAVRICSHATADVQIALRYQCLCDRVHSQASAFVLLQPENLTVSMTVYFGRPVCRGTWRYRHGIDRHAHPQRQAKSRSLTSSATAAACICCVTPKGASYWRMDYRFAGNADACSRHLSDRVALECKMQPRRRAELCWRKTSIPALQRNRTSAVAKVACRKHIRGHSA